MLRDFESAKRECPNIGLLLNESKCEIITDDFLVAAHFRGVAPSIVRVTRDDAILQGAPVTSVLRRKLTELKCLTDRLTTLHTHDAFCLLPLCFSIHKLLYTLRSAPRFADGSLGLQYERVIEMTLQSLVNIDLSASVASLTQAVLLVSAGGLGIRMATDIALAAFMSSITKTKKNLNK